MEEGTSWGFRLRLHLIRHGETESNYAGLVLGQTDSPLTDRGFQQALQSGMKLDCFDDIWRWYSSDLGRAKQTAKLLSNSVDWKWDVRLRELGKGVREGRCKNLSYSQALELFQQEHPSKPCIPLLETDEDAMRRFNEWIQHLLIESADNIKQDANNTSSLVKHVLAVSHSGMIRTIVQSTCARDIPRNAEKDLSHTDNKLRLRIPNLSRTIIDIIPCNNDSIDKDTTKQRMHWNAKLITLADICHLSNNLIS